MKTPFESEPSTNNQKPKRRPWNEEDEKDFVKKLEDELEKVYTFQRVRVDEIVRRIKSGEDEVQEMLSQLEKAQDGGEAEALEEQFLLLEQDLRDVIADVHELAKFSQLNYTGFTKIIKKHDVGTCQILWSARAYGRRRNKHRGILSRFFGRGSRPGRSSEKTTTP